MTATRDAGLHPRTYALALIAAAAGLFLALVGANLIFDPQAVFGTQLFPPSANINFHYQRLRGYQAGAREYEGVVLGSSRAATVPADELWRRMDGVRFAKFDVAGGTLLDHLRIVEYVLADKARSGGRLRAAFLLIDADSLDRPAWTNQTMQTLLPPQLSGENPVAFWWKNLTAVQTESWRNAIRRARPGFPVEDAPDLGGLAGHWLARAADLASAAASKIEVRPAVLRPADGESPGPIAGNPNFVEQLDRLRQLVRLCREHGTRLVVAVSPLHRAVESRYDPRDLDQALERLASIVPVWDFTGSAWLSDEPGRWSGDTSHFDGVTARMMLARIFGDPLPNRWGGFGRLRQP